tara:strand:+ start:531 stop:704 length:174 start_codon:yes stop_codon:yes gene_type:complete
MSKKIFFILFAISWQVFAVFCALKYLFLTLFFGTFVVIFFVAMIGEHIIDEIKKTKN